MAFHSHPLRAHRLGSVQLLALVLVANSAAGCSQPAAPAAPAAKPADFAPGEAAVVVPDANPQDLLALIQNAADQARTLAESPPAADTADTSRDQLARSIFTASKAADKLVAHPAATDEHRKTARTTKLALLYLGVRHDRPVFEPRFEQFAAELHRSVPGSEEAAVASACLLELRLLAGPLPPPDFSAALTEHAKTYPASSSGIALFCAYAERLDAAGNRRAAIDAYQTALKLYAAHPDLAQLQSGLAALEHAELARAERRASHDRALAEKRAQIKSRLGNHADGYFVVYAEENPALPRQGMIYFYHYEYEVLQGLDHAFRYLENLPDRWSWRLIEHFPNTPEGKAHAYDLWRDLRTKKTKPPKT